jgi:hypothetical protein
MRIGLVTKLSLTVLALLLFGLGLVAYLNYARYAETNRALLRSRVQVMGLELRDSIQAPMTLGVALQNITVLDDIVARAQARWPELLAVAVVAPTGSLIAGKQPAVVIDPPKATQKQGTEQWSRDITGAFVLGIPLANSFGRTEGHLVLYQDRAALEAGLQVVAWKLVRLYGFIAAPLALIGVIGVALALRGVAGELQRIDRRLDGTLADAPHGVLEQGVEGFRNVVAGVNRRLDEGENLLAQGSRSS